MALAVKICGLTTEVDRDLATALGARYLGFVFYPPSPRSLAPEAARPLVESAAGSVATVGVFVDPDDAWLDAVLTEAPLDFLQLHGAETPERVAEVKARTGRRVIKALAVADAADVSRHRAFLDVADMLLFDAKPPKVPDAIPGGNGLAFDWRLLAGKKIALPWLLAGGLDETNLEEAIRLTGAPGVDVSSRIEIAPGVKDPERLRRLLERARELSTLTV